MATRYLYLVRHGNYNMYNNPDELGGGLTLLGRDQATYAGEYFQHIPVTSLHASTMRRAMETAEIIQQYLSPTEIQPSRVLWECIPVIPPHLKEDFARRYPDLTPEKVEEQRHYADQAFNYYFRPPELDEEHLVAVAHGNLIRYLTLKGIEVNPAAWTNMRPFQCSITRFLIDSDEGIVLVSFGDIAHLPEDVQLD